MTHIVRHNRGFAWAALLTGMTLASQSAVAQGGEQEAALAGITTAVPAARSHLEPARRLLGTLVGTWRFELRLAGNYDGPPDASGTRVVRELFDDLRLEWTEELDHSGLRGLGVLGFDPKSNRFFSNAVYSSGYAPELLSGRLDDAGPLITFNAIPNDPGAGTEDGADPRTPASSLTFVDRDHLMWTAADRGWRAVYTRLE
jgi:hypothetical protein